MTLQRAGNGPQTLLLSDPVPATFLDTGAISPTNLSFNSRWPPVRGRHGDAVERRDRVYLVTGNSTVEVAYMGNKARNLDVTITPNNTPWGIDGSIVANRPFPEFGTLGMRAPLGHSDYHALQAKYERRFSAGWYTLASYTLAAGYSEAPDFRRRRRRRAEFTTGVTSPHRFPSSSGRSSSSSRAIASRYPRLPACPLAAAGVSGAG